MSRKYSDEKRNNIVVGLDIGTTKVCAIVGMRNENGKINILGIGKAPSLGGVSEGVVKNINKTIESISKAIKEAEKTSNIAIGSVFAGIAGRHIKSETRPNSRYREDPNSVITREELNRMQEQMMRIPVESGSRILHILPQDCYIDGSISDDPDGMYGNNIEVNYHIITGQIQAAENIKRCITKCDINVSDIIVEPIASAKAVLTDEELDAGVAILDIGGGTSDLAIFYEGRIRYTKVIPFGGEVITKDIVSAFKISEKYAEAIKVQYGDAIPTETRNNEVVVVPGINDRPSKQVSLKNLSLVINARLTELFKRVDFEIENSGLKDKLTAGIVITGGGAQMNNIQQLLEFETQLDVKIGYPSQHLAKGAVSDVNSPMFATGAGLLIYGIEKETEGFNFTQNQREVADKTKSGNNIFNKFKGSFMNFLSDGFEDNKDDFN